MRVERQALFDSLTSPARKRIYRAHDIHESRLSGYQNGDSAVTLRRANQYILGKAGWGEHDCRLPLPPHPHNVVHGESLLYRSTDQQRTFQPYSGDPHEAGRYKHRNWPSFIS